MVRPTAIPPFILARVATSSNPEIEVASFFRLLNEYAGRSKDPIRAVAAKLVGPERFH
jgi:hypothetical protein